MNAATGSAPSPFLDEPWRRLLWITPIAIAVWSAMLLGFVLLLKQAAAPSHELPTISARVVELPPSPVGGLQSGSPGAPPPQPRAQSKPKPKPHPHLRHEPIAHPHPRKELAEPKAPPSPTETRKEAPARPTATNKSAQAGANAKSTAPASEKESGNGSGLGSDNLGARAIYSPTPEIPDDLREGTFQAVAVAHFDVSRNGEVKVTLAKATADPRLNQILLSTLRQWRFFPAMKDGMPIDSSFDVRIPISVQ